MPMSDADVTPSKVMAAPVMEHRHRNVQGGIARASVFGASDGLVSNVSLILGVAGAGPEAHFVRLAGIAGLIAGAVSMAAGEYVSMRAQTELFEHELELERIELKRNPNVELEELTYVYQEKGVEPATARQMAEQLMRDPERALEAHAREELGIDPTALGSPVGASVGSFFAFSAGALVPLVPWFFLSGNAAILASVITGVLGATIIGSIVATFSGRPMWHSAGRQVLIATVAAGVTFGAGKIFGVATS